MSSSCNNGRSKGLFIHLKDIMDLNKLLTGLYYIGMILLFAGIVMHIVEFKLSVAIYIIGLLPIFGVRIFNFIIGQPENRRKHGILLFSGLALVAAGVAMYFGRSYWIVFIAISAVLDFYISFRRF
jgi:hypothetical protein